MQSLDFPLLKIKEPTNCLRESDFTNGGYEFGCNPSNWNFPDSLKICMIENGRLTWLTETEDVVFSTIISAVEENVIPHCEGKILVSGAHYIPNLQDLTYSGEGPKKTLDLSLSTIELLRGKVCQKVDFLFLIDDLYMMFDNVRLRSEEYNYYRQILFNPPCLPTELADRLTNYRERNSDFELFYITEKNIADRFNRHIKNRKYVDSVFINGLTLDGISKDDWYVSNPNVDNIRVIKGNKPTCPAAMAALARDISFKIDNRKQTKRYDTFIGYYPHCSAHNVTAGFIAENIVYKTGLKTFLIFTTTKCF
jgi:hypothetical protein